MSLEQGPLRTQNTGPTCYVSMMEGHKASRTFPLLKVPPAHLGSPPSHTQPHSKASSRRPGSRAVLASVTAHLPSASLGGAELGLNSLEGSLSRGRASVCLQDPSGPRVEGAHLAQLVPKSYHVPPAHTH